MLVDADLNVAGLTSGLDLQEAARLRDAIAVGALDPSSQVRAMGQLDMLPVGRDSMVSDEHLSLTRMRAVIEELRSVYQLVLIDAGSTEDNLSASLVTALADQVAVVVRAGERVSDCRRALKRLELHTVRPPLLVFNDALRSDPGQELPAPERGRT